MLDTGSHTPAMSPIFIPADDTVIYGPFTQVTRHWNVSTGEEVVCKTPIVEYIKSDWEEVRAIIDMVKHVSKAVSSGRNERSLNLD